MGLMASRISGYTDVLMMPTDAHIHFKDMLQKQWTTAQAAGRMESIQSQQAVGSGAAPGTASAWGMGFYGISSAIYSFSMFGIPLGLILCAVVYLLKASQAAMAASIFITVFFLVFFIMFHAPIAHAGIVSGTNILVSVVFAGIAAAVVGFFIYSDKEETDPPIPVYDPQNPQQPIYPDNNIPPYAFI